LAVPLYEYECKTCGTFEQIRRFSDPPLEACPKCTGPVEKLLSAPAFQFKGTGWYVTDYAKKDSGSGEHKTSNGETKGPNGDKSSSSESSGGGSSSEGKSTPESKSSQAKSSEGKSESSSKATASA
jgi:putative FmdB family regulatory protein